MDTDSLKMQLTVERSSSTLRSQTLDKLRTAIIEGHLPPGMRLVERKLCDLLGVSRTLVREALRHLESEGWVQNLPYKGPMVAVVSADDARQLYEVREALEGMAARLCAQRATEDDLGRLGTTLEHMEQAEKAGDVPAHVAAVERFYEVMLGATGNALLAASLHAQHDRLAWLRALSLGQPRRGLASIEEKRRLVAAIRARDAAAAQVASEFHVREAAKVTVAAMAAREPGAD